MYSEIISIEISLKLNKSETKDNKVCRIGLVIPGYDMLAGAQCRTFEAATSVARSIGNTDRKTKNQINSKKDNEYLIAVYSSPLIN